MTEASGTRGGCRTGMQQCFSQFFSRSNAREDQSGTRTEAAHLDDLMSSSLSFFFFEALARCFFLFLVVRFIGGTEYAALDACTCFSVRTGSYCLFVACSVPLFFFFFKSRN